MSDQEQNPPRANPPLPPREHPLLIDLAKEGKEADLWDLDNGADASADEASSGASNPSPAKLPERKKPRKSMVVRSAGVANSREDTPQPKTGNPSVGVTINVRSKGGSGKSEMEKAAERKVESEFDELDDWEEESENNRKGKADLLVSSLVSPEPVVVDPPSGISTPVETGSSTQPAEADAPADAAGPEEAGGKAEQSPAGKPEGKDPLTPSERIGLVALAVLLVSLAAGAYYWSIHQLPKNDDQWGQVTFPVSGRLIKVSGAHSYWRAPVLGGETPDRVRRGTQLIPVVELDVAGGPAALRVRFRDQDRNVVGDPITRTVSSAGRITIAATVGFEDTGMHAAYRTGQLKPWTVEVFEAGSADAPGSEFSMIMEMKLSSELR